MRFGGDFRRFQLNLLFDSNARGSMNFDPFFTASAVSRNGTITSGTGGNAVAELLLGVPDQASVSRSFAGITGNTVTGFRTYSLNYFAQDDWRVRPNLTLNIGLRWEYNSPVIDKYNHMGTFDPTAPGDLRISTPQKQNLYDASKHQFAPRFGFAYTPWGPKTVIRGGYGVFWDDKLLNIHLTPALSPPFLVPLSFQQSTNGLTNINVANPFAGQPGVGAPPASTWLENPFLNGYVQQWSLNVQHELPGAMGLSVGYVGSKGTHLDHQYNANLPQPSAVFLQANRPYPAFGNITVDSASGVSSYNALQASLEKRFSKGLSFLLGYTYSKSIDNGSSWNAGVINVFNFAAERGLSTFDTRNRFVASYTYDLPVGKGHALGGNMPAVANFILGGWQTNGIWRFDDGMPLALSVSNSRALPTYGAQRPNLIGPLTRSDSADWLSQYFANPQNAVTPAPFTVGNAPRTIPTVRAPGTATSALSLFKQFRTPLREGSNLEFRAEAFNALNHPQFAAPNTTVGSSAFGKVTAQANSPRQVQLGLKLYF